MIKNNVYDRVLELEDWYDEEFKKLECVKDFCVWKLKSKLLQNQYFKAKRELMKNKDPFSLKGDMNAKHIYHYTDGKSLIDILNTNVLIGGGNYIHGGISFTSHPNLYKRGFVFWYPNEYSTGRHTNNTGIKIKFDFCKMKEDVLPFVSGSERIGTNCGECEIRLLQDELENPKKYIKEIIIFKGKESNYLEVLETLENLKIKNKIV